jgi:pyruvate formate lyase activating enzyme
VLETLVYLARETDVWLEITTLVIPGHNDSDTEIAALATWVRRELGAHVPLHLSGFHPDFRMQDVPATPPATLRRARELALAAGLEHVYLGNVRDAEGDTTRCTRCRAPLIVRDWYAIEDYALTADGRCPRCDTRLAGRFEDFDPAAQFGRRRIPVVLRERD